MADLDNIFAELQMLTRVSVGIPKAREDLTRLCEFMKTMSYYEEQLDEFAYLRQLKVDTLKKLGGFMVDIDETPTNLIPEEFHHESLGFMKNDRIIYEGRFVLPIYDVKGKVAGLTGYDKFEEPKYLDSVNYGYKAKETMFYGMEKLPEFYENKFIIMVEGPMCRAWMLENDIPGGAFLGSYINDYTATILRRFGRHCIIIPDNDEAGSHCRKQAKYAVPEARVFQPLPAKDIDDSRKVEPGLADDLRGFIANPNTYIPKFFV